jgi:hypothetical protein
MAPPIALLFVAAGFLVPIQNWFDVLDMLNGKVFAVGIEMKANVKHVDFPIVREASY